MSRSLIRKILQYVGRYRGFVVLSLIFNCITVILNLYIPILFGNAIDYMIGENRVLFVGFSKIILSILILLTVSFLLTWTSTVINHYISFHVVEDLRLNVVNKLQRLPFLYLDQQTSGELTSRVISDVEQVGDGLLLGMNQLFSGVMTIIVTLIFMFYKSWMIALLIVIFSPIGFLVSKLIASRSYQLFQNQSHARGKLFSYIEEMVGNQKLIHAYAYQERASKEFSLRNENLGLIAKDAVFYSSLTNPSTRIVNNIVYAAVALSGCLMILSGSSLTVGGLSTLLAYANQYMKPFNDISSVITELQNGIACAYRVFELLDNKEEKADCVSSFALKKGSVQFQNVSFRYTQDHPFIENFSLDVPSGSRVAIVGETGSGKTTLMNLILRFYDIDGGDILIDGTSIYDMSRDSLRKNFGMVLQDVWLKHVSVRENITFGKEDASEEEIILAAKNARSWSFIKRLPDGLDTIVTDDNLSLGQQQLLCITRVMLCSPPMLILDEATSNIDTRTEIQIQKAFDEMMKGKTSFIVAHRLSTIQSADMILVMKDGRLVERGKHEALLHQGGFYSQLYHSQFVK